MITRRHGFFWFSIQLAIAVGGAGAAIISPLAGWVLAAITLPACQITLLQGWRVRENPSDNKALADGLAVAGLGVFLPLLFTTGLQQALGALLLIATLAMNTQMNKYRTFYIAQLISFIFLLVGAAESTSGHYLIIMALYCLFATFSLSEAWLDNGASGSEPINPPAENEQEASGIPLAQRLTLAGASMALAFTIYLLIPRPEALNWGGQQSSAADFYQNKSWLKEAKTSPEQRQQQTRELLPGDLDDKADLEYQELKEISELSEFSEKDNHESGYQYDGFNESFDVRSTDRRGAADLNSIVARMKAPHGSYLKIRTFDTFDGLSWKSAKEDISQKIAVDLSGKVTLPTPAALDKLEPNRFQQVITIEQAMPAWLPAAANPIDLWVPASVIAIDQFGQPLLPGPLQPGTRYTVQSQLVLMDKRPVSYGPAPNKQDLQLPRRFDRSIRRLAEKVVKGTRDPFQKAQKLEHHLRNNYDYSFESITSSQGHTPLSDFLFKNKKGHCEYFASAMTIMLRSLNIPARLVTGFSANIQNPLTGYYEIRAIDGHAWTEAWIDDRWVTFEPTAYYNLPRPQRSTSAAEQISQYADDVLKRGRELTKPTDDFSFSDIDISQIISRVWLSFYSTLLTLLSMVAMVLSATWPFLTAIAILLLIAWISRPYWLNYWWAQLSLRQINRYQPNDAASALHFYLYHLQRVWYQYPRQADQTIDDWVIQLLENNDDEEKQQALTRLADLTNAVFYYQQEVEPNTISATVTELIQNADQSSSQRLDFLLQLKQRFVKK